MNDQSKNVVVRFNQQQLQLLDNVKRSGKFGNSYEEVIRSAFHLYVEQTINRSQP
jgi:hypothetical protein